MHTRDSIGSASPFAITHLADANHSYIPTLKSAGEERVRVQLEAQAAHEARVDALSYAELKSIAAHDPVIKAACSHAGSRR